MDDKPNPSTNEEDIVTEAWRTYLTTGKLIKGYQQAWFEHPFYRPLFRALPKDPRCQICYIPFEGVGGMLARRMLNVFPSRLNPSMCNLCEKFAERYLGGVELEVSILFADIRGSTPLAEKMETLEFSHLIHRFYNAATRPLYSQNALIEKFVGDGLTAFFVPAFSGPRHARSAIEAGKGILRATGHMNGQKPWIPVGVGIHTGAAYIGSLRIEGGHTDISILGDAVNTAARLCSQANAGEILVSRSAQNLSGLTLDHHELRRLALKGKQETVEAWIIKT
jgi:adenylate cyclase